MLHFAIISAIIIIAHIVAFPIQEHPLGRGLDSLVWDWEIL